jgi:activator of 2-hydroxyglutaryl-CoA dehydratase
VIATGAGHKQARAALKGRSITERSIVSCVAKGTTYFYPQAKAVLDAGADSVTAIRLAADDSVEASAGHSKCAAFTGLFLDYLAA